MPQFKFALDAYFDAHTRLAGEVMQLVRDNLVQRSSGRADGSNLERLFGEQHTSSARLNYYPPHDPLSEDEQAGVNALGDMALHHHTDPGAITLLLQDDTGGLQALSREEGWIDVPPTPGAIVVNLGDVVQAWSNDQYVAAVHRVLHVDAEGQGRYSTPFFYQPRFDAVIEPWAEAVEDQPLYQPFTWREFIYGRVTDNYSDLGEDDIQVTRYRVAANA